MEPVPQRADDFSRVVEVGSGERAVHIERIARIRNIQYGEAERPPFADRFSEQDVGSRMRGQVIGSITFQDAGTINDIGGEPGMPGRRYRSARA